MEALVTWLFGVFLLLLAFSYIVLVFKARRLRSTLQSQGISGPPPSSFLLGNIPQIHKIKLQMRSNMASAAAISHLPPHPLPLCHDWPSILFPHFKQWQNQYGSIFLYSTGNMQILCIMDPDMVKEIGLCTSLDLGKPSYLSKERGPLLGLGILSSSGPFWAFQRKTIAPEFYVDKVKGMVGLMVAATSTILRSWYDKIDSSGGTANISVDEDLRSLSADIISRAAFGSSYSQGKEIFLKLRALQKAMAESPFVGIPGSRFFPTRNNSQIRRLNKEINSMILKLVKERTEATQEQDFLQMILEGAKIYGDHANATLNIDHDRFIVDNCKNIYFAGHETTAVAAAWSLMLLAAYPDWQARARDEVLEICRNGLLDADHLRNMKVLTLVIQETLRLYPPVMFVVRAALQDMKLKDVELPKGIDIQIPISFLHHNKDLWGFDVHEFNPQRFASGIAGACKVPQAYMPFGLGPRVCLGQHFAFVELKVILSRILSKFSFSLSHAYQHSPAFRLVIEPEHGVSLLIRSL
ncbi:hypothetical protein Nepgr_028386 [Nepenthes gracilis]|uniref:Cytochrome P450 n=1 Tax=Nepenthes gracilis TaxID=150966 RepID=A0AAD3TC89_NEPGR|nr:hypothetical protein Nepgr_028386 [Nepenthes gracilis]